MNKLSVILTFWDGDYDQLPHIVEKIVKHIRIPYELILVDNREKNVSDEPEKLAERLNAQVRGASVKSSTSESESVSATTAFETVSSSFLGCVHYKSGYNASCIPGRIFGAKQSSGKYLWFIDVDDDVDEIADSSFLENDADILSFYYNSIPSDSRSNPLESEFGKFIYNCGVSVWNKWYLRESFLAAEEGILKTGLKFYGEDFVYNYFVFHLNKSYKSIEKNIYFHGPSSGSVNGIYRMNEVFDWSLRANFSSTEMEDMHKIYVNFIFQSIYNELNLPDDRSSEERHESADKKVVFFKERLVEARDKGWLEGIIAYNRYTPENLSEMMSKITRL